MTLCTTKKLTATAFCLGLFVVAAHAQDYQSERWENGIVEAWVFNSDRYTQADAAATRERWQTLENTAQASSDAWAGDYQIGEVNDVRMRALRWSPEGGFALFNVNACAANVDEVGYGEVTSTTDYITLSFAQKAKSSTPRVRKFVKAKWGEQRYLVEEKDVADFCNQISGYGVFDGSYFLHNDDRDKSLAEMPTVPLQYQKFVRKPIDAVITKVENSYTKVGQDEEWSNEVITPVVINAGTTSGVKRGMTLHVLGSGLMNEQVEIKRAYRSTSRGVIVRTVRKQPGIKLNEWDDGYDTPQPPISVGMKLTTGLYKQLQDYEEDSKYNSNNTIK